MKRGNGPFLIYVFFPTKIIILLRIFSVHGAPSYSQSLRHAWAKLLVEGQSAPKGRANHLKRSHDGIKTPGKPPLCEPFGLGGGKKPLSPAVLQFPKESTVAAQKEVWTNFSGFIILDVLSLPAENVLCFKQAWSCHEGFPLRRNAEWPDAICRMGCDPWWDTEATCLRLICHLDDVTRWGGQNAGWWFALADLKDVRSEILIPPEVLPNGMAPTPISLFCCCITIPMFDNSWRERSSLVGGLNPSDYSQYMGK